MPGPTSTASRLARVASRAARRRERRRSRRARLRQRHDERLGHGEAERRRRRTRTVASCSLPAPARSAATPASSTAPGTCALPPTTSTRPRSSLSPSPSERRQRHAPQQRARDACVARRARRSFRRRRRVGARRHRARRPPRAARRSCSVTSRSLPPALPGEPGRIERVLGDAAVGDVAVARRSRGSPPRHLLDEIAQAEHDDLVRDDEHARARLGCGAGSSCRARCAGAG